MREKCIIKIITERSCPELLAECKRWVSIAVFWTEMGDLVVYRTASVRQSWCCGSEALLILPSRVRQGKHLLHCTAFHFTCNQQSLAWAYRLQTRMIPGIPTCNLPTRIDPEGPEEMFGELCISNRSCNLTYLQR